MVSLSNHNGGGYKSRKIRSSNPSTSSLTIPLQDERANGLFYFHCETIPEGKARQSFPNRPHGKKRRDDQWSSAFIVYVSGGRAMPVPTELTIKYSSRKTRFVGTSSSLSDLYEILRCAQKDNVEELLAKTVLYNTEFVMDE